MHKAIDDIISLYYATNENIQIHFEFLLVFNRSFFPAVVRVLHIFHRLFHRVDNSPLASNIEYQVYILSCADISCPVMFIRYSRPKGGIIIHLL